MKIYHTKTQEDYDALMRELKIKGCKTFDDNIWLDEEENTCVSFDGCYISYDDVDFYKTFFPNDTIIEYTAKKPHDNVNSLIKSVSNDNEELYRKIIQELKQTYLAKNKDYGNSFEQSLDEHGEIAGVVRIGDKFNRAKTLVKKECDVLDESKVDTYLDMANYCIMQAMWLIKQEG